MRLLHKHTATLRRVIGVDDYDDKGNLVEASRVDSTITCVIHPSVKKSVYQDSLPQGISSSDYRIIRTAYPIFSANDKEKTNADYILFDGIEYEVFVANPWPSPSERLNHYEGIIIKRDFLG